VKLPLRGKLASGLGALALLILAVGAVATHEVGVQARHTDRLVDASLPEAHALGAMSTQLYALRSVQADMVIAGPAKATIFAPLVRSDVAAMDAALAAHRRLAAANGGGRDRRLASFAARWRSYVGQTAQLPALVAAGDRAAAARALSRGLPTFLLARTALAGL
jgi:hypothetical protein